ncbi:MAG: GH92 family glycosyl hydrolase [Prevotella sp.]|nr:GH92 family glycosyl hydrolase [Prevotella sp.]
MHLFRLLLALAILFLSSHTRAANLPEPVDYVSTLVGSASKYTLSTGNTYPAVTMPWGMNAWVPQTGKNGDGWTYTYAADKIRGFKQTRQPSPWINDYGAFCIFPETGQPTFDEERRASWFSHKAEEARPYYYGVYLADYDIKTELTATMRAAILRFTFPQTESASVVIDGYAGGSSVRIIPSKRMIVGYVSNNHGGVPDNFRNYFVIVFDKPFSSMAAVTDGTIRQNVLETTCDHAGAIVGFKTRKGEQVHARVASSFISLEQAEQNLNELEGKDFEEVKAEGRKTWNDILGRVEVKDDNIDHLRTFYSCLYRSVMFPHSLYEVDKQGNIIHYSPYNGKVLPGYMFTDTGFWDTFRALFPLLNLLYSSVNTKIQEGLANAYRESGFLPEWASPGHRDCMVGNNSASVVADALLSGIRSADTETLWQAVVHGTKAVHPKVNSTGRLGHEYYNTLGYVPYDVKINENVARTLEYAYDDWCIYQMGKALGRPEKELAVYARRALNYRNVFDKQTGLMRGRLKNGQFQSPFNPLKWGDAFTEGNSWHYSWSVFHDPQGLITLMGGAKRFTAMLDSVFILPPAFDDSYYGQVIHEIREMQIMNMGNYAHGNQPIQHMPYLYCYAGEPWKTQYHVRQIMDRLYSATPDGYCGDEDNGQTSAWYVFSALGFYPVCPGSGEYVLGTPYFSEVTLHVENGQTVCITAPNNSSSTPYVSRMTIDGEDYTHNFIRRDRLTRGTTIRYEMSALPNTQRGTAVEDAPYSFSRNLPTALSKYVSK